MNMASDDAQYIVFIRVPFPRGNFVDPPPVITTSLIFEASLSKQVDWNAAKDKQLSKILSNTSRKSDIDWNNLATKFEVPLTFLLQQIACLYELKIQQMKAQIRKFRDPKVLSVSPVVPEGKSGSTGVSQEPITFVKSGSSTVSRVSPALTHRRDPIVQPTTLKNATRVNAPIVSHKTNANNHSASLDIDSSSSQTLSVALNHESRSPKLKCRPNSSITQPPVTISDDGNPSDSSSIHSLSDSELSTLNSVLRRPLRFTQKPGQSKQADDDEDELAFMPLKFEGDKLTPTTQKIDSRNNLNSVSETTIASDQVQQLEISNSLQSQFKFKGRDDGTPSMGSSFSDLDDTSVTQSALEEALASNMRAGGMASRMSTISQALKSKYLQ
ncbi:Autophagy-related protein 29 [Golovinomyces cichoracearum]|uniref:Autophagy-related protein 29 n=1 Tax=Golovinomyces cichoracearum TaxID=62708 RepID=A0A420HMT0_9PEZI|nr:Autophagy-related protein 29 [Golovinomyces cichoracearum]